MSGCSECPINHPYIQIFVTTLATVAYDLVLELYQPTPARWRLLDALHAFERDWENNGLRDPAKLLRLFEHLDKALREYKSVRFGLPGLAINGLAEVLAIRCNATGELPRRRGRVRRKG